MIHSYCPCLHSHLFLFQSSLSSLQPAARSSADMDYLLGTFLLNNLLQTFNIPTPNISGLFRICWARWNINPPNSFRVVSYASICLKKGEGAAMGGWTIRGAEGGEAVVILNVSHASQSNAVENPQIILVKSCSVRSKQFDQWIVKVVKTREKLLLHRSKKETLQRV